LSQNLGKLFGCSSQNKLRRKAFAALIGTVFTPLRGNVHPHLNDLRLFLFLSVSFLSQSFDGKFLHFSLTT